MHRIVSGQFASTGPPLLVQLRRASCSQARCDDPPSAGMDRDGLPKRAWCPAFVRGLDPWHRGRDQSQAQLGLLSLEHQSLDTQSSCLKHSQGWSTSETLPLLSGHVILDNKTGSSTCGQGRLTRDNDELLEKVRQTRV